MPTAALGLADDATFDFNVTAFDNYFTGAATDGFGTMTYNGSKPRVRRHRGRGHQWHGATAVQRHTGHGGGGGWRRGVAVADRAVADAPARRRPRGRDREDALSDDSLPPKGRIAALFFFPQFRAQA